MQNTGIVLDLLHIILYYLYAIKGGLLLRKFDYGFLESGTVPAGLVNAVGSIYSLQTAAAIRKQDYAGTFEKLEQSALLQSVRYANAAEGMTVTDRILSSVPAGTGGTVSRTEAQCAGYMEALSLVGSSYDRISVGEKDLASLHVVMKSPSGDMRAGKLRQSDTVISFPDERTGDEIRFRTVSAAETRYAMGLLELAYLVAESNKSINPLLLIPCVLLDFLCIYPFSDSNLRTCFLISHLLLDRAGFDAGRYVSLEEQVYRHRDLFFEAFRLSAEGWETNRNDYFPFAGFFLSMLGLCYKELDKIFAGAEGRKISKTGRVEGTVLSSDVPVTKAEICRMHPDISQTTVEAVLGKMVKSGRIKKLGSAKGSRYVRND